MLNDLRFALRLLRRSPGFTAAAVSTLALGVGATTAVFSVVHAVLLAPLPFRDADRLVRIWESKPDEGLYRAGVSAVNVLAWRQGATHFEGIEEWAVSARGSFYTIGETTVLLQMAGARPELFQLLGVEPIAGSLGDGWLVSERFARRRFGGIEDAIGQTMLAEAGGYGMEPHPVAGVIAAATAFPDKVDLWATYAEGPAGRNRTNTRRRWQAIGRLRPGVTLEEARTELQRIEDGLAPADATNRGWRVEVVPLRDSIVEGVRAALIALYGATGLVLLIGCVNVANLLLARGAARRGEFAVRWALGATRARLRQQALVESLVLTSAGAVAGVALAALMLPVLVSAAPAAVPRAGEIRLEAAVLAGAAALAAIIGVLLGLAAGRPDRSPAWTQGRSPSTEPRRGRRTLVAVEVALSLVLLTGATLLARSYVALTAVGPGFEPSGVLTARIRHPVLKAGEEGLGTYPYPRFARVTQELLDEVRAIPAVESAGAITYAPLSEEVLHGYAQPAPGAIAGPPTLGDDGPIVATPRWPAVVRQVTTGFFDALRIPVLAGRSFTEADAPDPSTLGDRHAVRPPGVAVVSRSFADTYFPGENPLGRFLVVENGVFGRPSSEIVGIVGDVHFESLAVPPGPAVYTPYSQGPLDGLVLVARGGGPAAGLARPLRDVIDSFGTSLAAEDFRSLEDIVGVSVATPRFNAALISAFAVLGLALAALGLYGVLAFLVGERTVEIGVRMALGAEPGQIARMVLRDGAPMVVVGLAAGLAGSVVAGRYLESLLFGVPPIDLLALAGAVATLLVVGAAACYLPARRAASIDPMEALRSESRSN